MGGGERIVPDQPVVAQKIRGSGYSDFLNRKGGPAGPDRPGRLFDHHHFPGFHKASGSYPINIKAAGYLDAHVIGAIPPNGMLAGLVAGIDQCFHLLPEHVVDPQLHVGVLRDAEADFRTRVERIGIVLIQGELDRLVLLGDGRQEIIGGRIISLSS